jgi:pimeloyl-ACP methyl ester carboxylesterase
MQQKAKPGFIGKLSVSVTALIIATGVATLMGRIFLRNVGRGLDAHTDEPATDYEMAIAKFARLQAQDDDTVNPVCRSQLLTHGSKTQRAIVLVHGLTNCPQQYAEFGPLLYQQGYNVLIPRMPRHGLIDRMTDDLKNLSAEELRDCSNATVDIACGLGEHVTYLGLSAGGVMAAWVAQHRPDVDKVVLIAPSFTISPHLGVRRGTLALLNLLLLPNIKTQDIMPFKDGPEHSYLGFSSRSLAEVMRLGVCVFVSALKTRVAVQSILLITNMCDKAVNNEISWLLVDRWRARGLERFEGYEFGEEHQLIHDIIDPQQFEQQTVLVYPTLLSLVTGTMPVSIPRSESPPTRQGSLEGNSGG